MNENLLSRRLFFKKAAKATLPILVGATIFPALVSCGGGDEDDDITGGSEDSSGTSDDNTGSSDNSTDTSDISSSDGSVSGYKYVDLGLSVKWATYNIGASSPEKYGAKYEFSKGINSYKYVNDIANVYRNAGYSAGDSISGSSFDQVCSKYGDLWHMPTKADVEELINNCDKEEIEYNGSTVYKYTSKKNKHSIYFPKVTIWTGTFRNLSSASGAIAAIFSPSSFSPIGRGIVGDDKYYIRPVTTGSSSSSTGCNSGCTNSCSNSSTSSSCSSCASSCTSGCKQQCDYNCAATCKSHCYGQCNDTCGGGCKAASKGSSCSGCARTCNNRCYSACTYACSSNCQSSCVGGSK